MSDPDHENPFHRLDPKPARWQSAFGVFLLVLSIAYAVFYLTSKP